MNLDFKDFDKEEKLYLKKLDIIKREISIIGSKKSRKFKPYQKKMINFINGKTHEVTFEIRGKIIILRKGDNIKGFKHILRKHYKNDLETMDILNLPIFFKNAIELNEQGVSNNSLTVYSNLKNQKEHRLIINEIHKDRLVVTTYRKI